MSTSTTKLTHPIRLAPSSLGAATATKRPQPVLTSTKSQQHRDQAKISHQKQLLAHSLNLAKSMAQDENTSLVNVLNEKCAALIVAEHSSQESNRRKADAEESLIVSNRKAQQLEAELAREHQRAVTAQRETSKVSE